jgi:diguanylate cyclase (GGDEF)-like protein/PAS domain S-box-containing protein
MVARRFLVVDDDDVDREKVKRLLKIYPEVIDVEEAVSVSDALLKLKHGAFDCLLIDYRLSDALGTEILSDLRACDTRPLPVIVISGNNDPDVVKEVMRAGAQDCINKNTLTAEILCNAIEAAVELVNEQCVTWDVHKRNRQLAEGLPQLAWSCLPDGSCEYLNRRWCEYTGIMQAEQLGFAWLNQVHPEDRDRFVQAWMTSVRSHEPMYIYLRLRRDDGEYRWFDTRALPERDEKGEVVRWLGTNSDVTEYETTRQALADSERRFRAAFDYAPLGMAIVTADGHILQANPAFNQLLGFAQEQQPNRRRINLLGFKMKDISHPSDWENEERKLRELQGVGLPVVRYEKRYLTKDNDIIFTVTNVSLVQLSGGESCYLYQVVDVTDRKTYESQLINLAHHDELTGLYNRVKLYEMFDCFLLTSQRAAQNFAVLFIDLDNFKQVNDSLGHEAGDQLLRVVARRMKKYLRQDDCVARLGGDEFIILLRDVADKQAVCRVVELLIEKISSPIRLDVALVHVGMSAGVAVYPFDGDTAQTLMRNADSALYDAKGRGRGCFQVYRPELTESANLRLMLDADLRTAINNEEFEIYYQPLIDMHSGKVSSLEALLRWNHPKKGLLSPDSFIDYAHESGLICQMGDWVIAGACAQLAAWRDAGVNVAVSINVSARQFQQDSLISRVAQCLSDYRVDPQYLIIEITEQIFMDEAEAVLHRVQSLRNLGVKISLDDFGTGYSSLNYIVRFSPDYLKIDRSFVGRIGEQAQHNGLVEAIVGLGRIVPLGIVAEGVETQAQYDFLMACGCNFAQGFYFSEPRSAGDISHYLTNAGACAELH